MERKKSLAQRFLVFFFFLRRSRTRNSSVKYLLKITIYISYFVPSSNLEQILEKISLRKIRKNRSKNFKRPGLYTLLYTKKEKGLLYLVQHLFDQSIPIEKYECDLRSTSSGGKNTWKRNERKLGRSSNYPKVDHTSRNGFRNWLESVGGRERDKCLWARLAA